MSWLNCGLGQIKKSMFRVTGLKILGRVGTHTCMFLSILSGKNIILCILKGKMPFKMHKIIFFPENLFCLLFV